MRVEGYLTRLDEVASIERDGYINDVKRTATFHFRSGYSGQDVTLPWVGPWPTMDDPRMSIWTLTLEPKVAPIKVASIDDRLCAKDTRQPQSHVTSLCRLRKGHEGRCEP